MTQILYSPASPYSAKVRMAAHYAGIPFESVIVNTSAEPETLIQVNPLGKIPTLVTDDGKAVFDSRAITQYLNRVSGNKLFPRNAEKRTDAERYEAIADGLCDVLLAHVYERRMPPERKFINPGSTCNGVRPNVRLIFSTRPRRALPESFMRDISRLPQHSAIWRCALKANGNATARS